MQQTPRPVAAALVLGSPSSQPPHSLVGCSPASSASPTPGYRRWLACRGHAVIDHFAYDSQLGAADHAAVLADSAVQSPAVLPGGLPWPVLFRGIALSVPADSETVRWCRWCRCCCCRCWCRPSPAQRKAWAAGRHATLPGSPPPLPRAPAGLPGPLRLPHRLQRQARRGTDGRQAGGRQPGAGGAGTAAQQCARGGGRLPRHVLRCRLCRGCHQPHRAEVSLALGWAGLGWAGQGWMAPCW